MFDGNADTGPDHPVATLIAAVSTGSAEAVDAALFSLSADQLAELVVQHERAARAFAAVGLAILRQAERCELGRTVGASSTPDWLRDVLRLAPSEANARTDLAVRLDVDAAALDHGAQVIATWQRDRAAQSHRTGYPRPGTVVDMAADRSERRSPLGLDADAVQALSGRAGGLPVTAAAVRAGLVSMAQAAVIARHLGNLPLGLDASTRADCEAFLATRALEHEPRALGRLGAQLVTTLTQRETATGQHDTEDDATADSGGDEGTDAEPEHPGQQSAQDRRRANADARTYFSLIDDGDGTVCAAGCFSEEAADLIRSALAPLAAPGPAVDGVKDQRPHAKRQAHALVELCRRSLDEGSLPGSRVRVRTSPSRPHSMTSTMCPVHLAGPPSGVLRYRPTFCAVSVATLPSPA